MPTSIALLAFVFRHGRHAIQGGIHRHRLSLIPHDIQWAAGCADRQAPRRDCATALFLGLSIRLRDRRRAAPLIATALFAAYGSGHAISVYIAACAVVSLVAAAFMPDYTGKDISEEYDAVEYGH